MPVSSYPVEKHWGQRSTPTSPEGPGAVVSVLTALTQWCWHCLPWSSALSMCQASRLHRRPPAVSASCNMQDGCRLCAAQHGTCARNDMNSLKGLPAEPVAGPPEPGEPPPVAAARHPHASGHSLRRAELYIQATHGWKMPCLLQWVGQTQTSWYPKLRGLCGGGWPCSHQCAACMDTPAAHLPAQHSSLAVLTLARGDALCIAGSG